MTLEVDGTVVQDLDYTNTNGRLTGIASPGTAGVPPALFPAGRAPTDVREAPRMERRVPNVQPSTPDERETSSGEQEVDG